MENEQMASKFGSSSFVWAACLMYFASGLATVILGGVLPPLLLHYHAAYATGGALVFYQFVGFLIGVPTASVIIHRFGYKGVLIGAALCISVALCGIALLPSIPVVYVLCVLNGFGIAATETGAATYTMESFVGRRAVIMSYLEVAFGLGALCMPALSSVLIAWQKWPLVFIIAGCLALIGAVGWMSISLNTSQEHELINEQSGAAKDALNASPIAHNRWSKVMMLSLFLAMIFLYVGVESSLSSFLPAIFIPYLHELPYLASLSVATFWLSMVIGRAATGWIVRKVPYDKFLLWSMIGTVVTLAGLTASRDALLCYTLVFLLGLFMSGIFSIAMVYANHAIPESARLVTSLVTVCAGLGGAVIPPLVGYSLDHVAIIGVLWIIAGSAGLLLLTLLSVQWLNARAATVS